MKGGRIHLHRLFEMIILGLNAYHADASAALVRDGRLVAGAEEERFRRVKHWAGLPEESIAWCLEQAGIALADVDVLAVNREPRANLWRKAAFALRHRPGPGLVRDRLGNMKRVYYLASALEPRFGAFRGRYHPVEHHLAHQASAFLVSPLDEAALLSVDGFGDFASASWGMGRGTDIRIDGRIHFPHSLGAFYLAMTQYLGFPKYGDEYKVMGLAPYGEPRFLPAMRRIVQVRADGEYRLDLRYFRHHDTDLSYLWDGGEPTVEAHFTPAVEELLGPARRPDEPLSRRHLDVARSVQARFEEAVLALLRAVHARHPTEAVVLSGGAAMNSVANGKITRDTPFRRVFVPPAPGDAGGAIGAALVAARDLHGMARNGDMRHSYYGGEFSTARCLEAVEAVRGRIAERGATVRLSADVCREVGRAIARGKVVGWFQGRMEFGPRALGNRSILGDPRRADMREILNAKIKLRESFRPFAPSILREKMGEWFVVDDDVPFMMKVFEVRPDKRHRVPAITHVDGTGRPHTVTRQANPLYYRLIETFAGMTGVPMVLNTSFNENEPIVHTPEEALDCFLRTDMDLLAMGKALVEK